MKSNATMQPGAMSMASSRALSRRRFIKRGAAGVLGGLATAALGAGSTEARAAQRRPNVLFMFTDDQRWDAMSCAGNPILSTPNMDRLAAEGLRFPNAFVTTAICAPARASFLTGKYAHTHGIQKLGPTLAPEQKTFAEILREAGYRTGYVGKYHLGGNEEGQRRFDYWGGFPGQGKYLVNGQHLTDILAERAVNFIREQGEGPFCLAVGFKAPHAQDGAEQEFQYAPRFGELFADVTIPYPPTYEGTYEKKPECVRNSLGRKRWGWRHATPEMFQRTAKDYYRLVAGVDEGVGRILQALDDTGLAGNTLVIYTSDHGFFLGEHGMAGKWLMYEESIRIPLLLRYPPLEKVSRTVSDMVLNIDVAPTILDFAGVEVPVDMQGRSFRALAEGTTDINWRAAYFYEYSAGYNVPPIEGVRTTEWKYIKYLAHKQYPVTEELYHLADDPHETTNLVYERRYADVLNGLRDMLAQLKFETRA